jgi:hypothetical protein
VISADSLDSTFAIDTKIENEMEISLDLETLQILSIVMAKMSEKSFMGFPIQGEFQIFLVCHFLDYWFVSKFLTKPVHDERHGKLPVLARYDSCSKA